MDNEEIRKRTAKLRQMRTIVEDTWDEIERYIAPYRGRFFKDERSENSIEWRRPYIYDSTAVAASQSLAANIHSSLTSPKLKWFDLRFRHQELNDNTDAKMWLDAVSDAMYKVLQDSNFTVQAGETYQDLVDFGTSIITEEAESEDEWKGINFSSVPLKEAYFEQDHRGHVHNFYRRLEMTPIQIVSKFPNAPEWIKEQAESSEYAEKKYFVIFAIFRRQEIDPDNLNLFKPLAPLARPYGTKWVMEESAESLADEGGYYEMPAFVPRWRKTSSSMWGNSPAMVALSDTITLNKLVEMQIGAMEKVVDPATLATERGLLGDLDLNAGGLTIVRSMEDIKVFESGARFDVSYQEIQRYRDQIREYFMIDQLMLPPMEGTPATATEIAARISQLERLIGPTLGRLQEDFLDPLITRTFNIMMRAGQIPEPPAVIMGNKFGLDIEYVGALARSQQQDQINAIDRWLMQIMQVAQINPEVIDIPNWPELLKGTGSTLGVPAKYMNTNAEIKKIQDERKAQQQQMMEAELMKMQAEASAKQGASAQ